MSKKSASPKKNSSHQTASRRSKVLQIIGLIVVLSFVISPLLPNVINRSPQPTSTAIVFPTDTPTTTPTPTAARPVLPTGGPPPAPTP